MASEQSATKGGADRAPLWAKLSIVTLFVAVAVFFLLRAPTDQRPGEATTAAAGGGREAGSDGLASGRCRRRSGLKAFRVGGDGSGPAAASAPGGGATVGDAGEEEGQRFAPFAVVVGRGVRFAGGFAVGVRRDTADGAVAEIAVVDPRSGAGRIMALGRSRGDLAAPLLAAAGDGLSVGLLEPNAGGFAIRLGRVADERVVWGDDLPRGRDESLAFDLAAQEDTTVVAWDEATRKGDRTAIVVAGLSSDQLQVKSEPRPVTRDEVDAELPRLVPRPGGFWLVYVARRSVELPPNPSDDDLHRDPEQGRYAAEMIEPSWLEAMPLEVSGRSAGAARPITPRDGHVQAFDLESGADDSVVLAWRDDDTPTGAQGGRVSIVELGPGGVGEPLVVATEDVGLGVPNLLPGWISVAAIRGEVRLAPLDDRGRPRGVLAAEPALGVGQLIAAAADDLLLAEPSGRAVDLTIWQCERRAIDGGASHADGGGGP